MSQYRLVTLFGGHEFIRHAESLEELSDMIYESLYAKPEGGCLEVVVQGVPGIVREKEFYGCLLDDEVYRRLMNAVPFDAIAETPSGKNLDVMMLYRWGEARKKNRRFCWLSFRYGFWNGEGPVPGTAKSRGGYSSWKRTVERNWKSQHKGRKSWDRRH